MRKVSVCDPIFPCKSYFRLLSHDNMHNSSSFASLDLLWICSGLLLLSHWSCRPLEAENHPLVSPIEKPAEGMVVSAHPLATEVGVKILQQGGNAVVAAVGVQFALAVVLPWAGNIGGGGFLLSRQADGVVHTLDFRETAPAAAKRDMFFGFGEATHQKPELVWT